MANHIQSWTLAIAIAVVAPSGFAQGREVEAEHERGQALRMQHRDAEALDVFRALYERTREPRALARMALAEFALGRFEVAEEHLVAALAAPGNPWIERNRGDLAAALQQLQAHLGWLDVTCETPGADLLVAGRRITSLPARQPLRIATGAVEFEVTAPGYEPAQQSAVVRAGATTTAHVSLRASGPGAPSLAAARSSGPGAWPWVVFGLGGAALAASAALYFGPYATARSDFDRQCPNAQCTPDTLAAGNASASDASTWGNLAMVSVGVGATAVVTGLLWYLVDRPSGEERPAARAVLVPARGGASLGLEGRF